MEMSKICRHSGVFGPRTDEEVLGTFRLSLNETETRRLADSAATVDKARRSLDDFL